MAVTPVIRGLYLCLRVDVDLATRNLSLQHCFRGLFRDPETGFTPTFYVVTYLANGLGTLNTSVRISRLDAFDEFYTTHNSVTFPDRLAEVRFKQEIRMCQFPAPGEYQVALWVNDELLALTPFRIRDRVQEQ